MFKTNKNIIKSLLKGTTLSILIFFSVSFVTVIIQKNSVINWTSDNFSFIIGFPFVYYYELWLDYSSPNYSWKLDNLIYDCLIYWSLITGLTILLNRKKHSR